ncbi:MAG: hypothetical protein FJX72_03600, partial [Armatimonadetes bacterium]|nr:hypothetical protein [Armatimonadota bacterium]
MGTTTMSRFGNTLVSLVTLLLLQGTAGAEVVRLQAGFGAAEVDTARPGVTALVLRRASGALEPRSILAPIGSPWPRGVENWGEGGYTYVVDAAGRRFTSRHSAPASLRRSQGKLVLDGIGLRSAPGETPVALERWVLSTSGGALSWTVERRWLADFTARLAATPGLFSSFRRMTDAELLPNSVTHTLWVHPDSLRSWFDPLYRAWPANYKLSLDNCAVVAQPDTWAVAKLWTSWHAQADPRLSVRGGHLYRRGFFGWRSELGAVSSPVLPRRYRRGERERVTLTIGSVDREATGYRLAVSIPDKAVEGDLRSFYGGLMNGGVVNDQKSFNFGNETDGWCYDGSTWMQGLALAAGIPAQERTAHRPYDPASAFRGHLASIVGTLDASGRGNFGYDWTGNFPDARLNNVIGAREYLMHTGDLAFVKQILPDLERGVGWFLSRRNAAGLADLGNVAHWYYDAMPSSGVNANHNALLYRACRCMAEMERAAGHAEKARTYTRTADEVRTAFNAVLWNEGAPGGPRITDWIAHSGEKVTYAADVCQFPAVAFGMLPKDRARRLIATLDRRIAEIERDHGYTGMASLSAYWPVPDHINTLEWQRPYTTYMNGGSFLAITYYEIMARIEAGDIGGAWERLRRFSRGVRRHSGAGNNSVTVRGEVAAGADEPYLSDMVVVPAALVRGFLGIEPTWDRLIVKPRLPPGWTRATAEVLYRGVRHRIVISDGRVAVTRLERRFTPPPDLTWEVRPAPAPEWQMTVSRHFANGATAPRIGPTIEVDGGRRVTLKRPRPSSGLLARWTPARVPASGVVGTVRFGMPGPAVGVPAAQFTGEGHQALSDPSRFVFSERESFTLQCRFRTEARDSRVMVSRPEAYCLYVKDGKLAAWIMQRDLQHREALGSTDVADGRWHHAAAVYDRAAQRIGLYLDGRLDTPDGAPGPNNPADMAPIGAASSTAPLCIGGLAGSFLFTGSLADVRVHAGALEPSRFAFPGFPDEPVADGRIAASGTYVGATCDWGQSATIGLAEIACAMNGGRIEATLELSADGFRSVARRAPIALREGRRTYPLRSGPFRYARLRFTLRAS